MYLRTFIEWKDEIEYFFENNPDMFCKESGVSLWSKNIDAENYDTTVRKHQVMLKKNKNTPTIDNTTSEMV